MRLKPLRLPPVVIICPSPATPVSPSVGTSSNARHSFMLLEKKHKNKKLKTYLKLETQTRLEVVMDEVSVVSSLRVVVVPINVPRCHHHDAPLSSYFVVDMARHRRASSFTWHVVDVCCRCCVSLLRWWGLLGAVKKHQGLKRVPVR